jgi:transporter family-2 protein
VLSILGHSPLFLAVAALAGLMMAVQGSINSVLGKKVGLWETTFVVHSTAAIILIIILFIVHHQKINLQLWKEVPWYLYLGGVIGVIITYSVAVSIPDLGVAVATTAIITGQVLTAAIIDHFGIFGLETIPFTWLKFLGIVFLALGVRLLLN